MDILASLMSLLTGRVAERWDYHTFIHIRGSSCVLE